MRRSNYIPSNVKVAIDNCRRAVVVRKNYERKLLDVIRTETQFIRDCEDVEIQVSCKEIVKASMCVIKALLYEYACDDALEIERKKVCKNESKN